jgi:Putative transposase/Transposase zinc-binding domain
MTDLQTRTSLEVGDILRAHGGAYRAQHPVTPEQAQVMRRLAACRTAALGGHVDACAGCGFTRISYNSCRDRHCPKCQAGKRAAWLETRLERLLPVGYFHVVFTLPDVLQPLLLRNQRRLYTLLFQAASATLLTLSADPHRLGAQIGVTAILHTWGQQLRFHPHLHCVVTGGGLSRDGQRWVAGQRQYFLPVKVLGKLFRGKFLAALKALYQAGQLTLTGSVTPLNDPVAFQQLLDGLYGRKWIVYAKRPFGGPVQVFRYLGRYSHRVAISNARLVSMDENHVAFQWKDYADGHQTKVMCLSAEEFLRRLLLHVLPKGFVRIRHYGLLASVNVATKLVRCRQLLGQEAQLTPPSCKSWIDRVLEWTGQNPMHCPHCQGVLQRRALAKPPSSTCPPAPAARALRHAEVADENSS